MHHGIKTGLRDGKRKRRINWFVGVNSEGVNGVEGRILVASSC
jgi:hypothetical protein